MKPNIKEFLDHEYHAHQRLFDQASLFLIIISVILFTIETVPELGHYHHWFKIADTIIVIIFSLEYVTRLYLSHSKKKFILSPFGIIDLLSILPFYLSFGFTDFRWFRILRVVRVFRIFKLTRYIKAADRLKLAYMNIREELFVFLAISFLLIYLSAVGVYYFERHIQPDKFGSIVHSLWWAVVTLTTVGYGDVYPVSLGGRIFTSIVLLLGLSMISIPSGLLASSFSKVMKEQMPDDEDDQRGKDVSQ